MGQRRLDKPCKERMRRRWFRFEFRMKLYGDKPRMLSDFNHFDKRVVRAQPAGGHTGCLKLIAITIVEFVTMAMAFGHRVHSVNLGRAAARSKCARVRAQSHRAAKMS